MAAPLASTTVGYAGAPTYSLPQTVAGASPTYSFPQTTILGTQTVAAAPAYSFPAAAPVITQAPTISYSTAAPVYQTMAAAAPVYTTPAVGEAASVYLPARTVDNGVVPAVQLLMEELPQLVTPADETKVAETAVKEGDAAAPVVVDSGAAAPSASYAAQLVNLIRGGAAEPAVEETAATEAAAETKAAEAVVVEGAAAVAAPVVTYTAAATTIAAPAYSTQYTAAAPSYTYTSTTATAASAPVPYTAPVEYSSLEALLANSTQTDGAKTGSYYLPSTASMLEVTYTTPAAKVEEETKETDGVVKKVVTKKKIGCC